jgi:hypothetical protein
VSPLGNVFVAVIVMPGQAAAVEELAFWSVDQPPVAQLDVTPREGDPQLSVALDAAGSSDPGGTIVKYEFDFGDGNGFVDYGAASVNHIYSTAGGFLCRSRVTDDRGWWAIGVSAVVVHGWRSQAISTGANDVGKFASLGTLADGRLAIACYDATNSAPVYFARNRTLSPCETADIAVDVDSSPGVQGYFTSLALADGHPVIGYYDFSSQTLKFAYSSSIEGRHEPFWTCLTIDSSSADVGWYVSLTLVNGKPAIAYVDKANGTLKYAYSSTVDGSHVTDWRTLVVDSVESAEASVKLAVVAGCPAIAYYDGATSQLKYASSSAVDGSSAWSCFIPDFPGSGQILGDMTEVNSHPALCYVRPGFPDSELGYAYCNYADGNRSARTVRCRQAAGAATRRLVIGMKCTVH